MAARRYAEGTEVPVERSKAEIEKLLRKHGAVGFMSGWSDELGASVLQCKLGGRMLKWRVEYPDPADFVPEPGGGHPYDPKKRRRTGERRAEEEHMRRWRALLLVIKAKLEIIQSGESTVDEEFMGAIMLPDGRRLIEWAAPQIAEMYESGRMPPLLPSGGGG